jgi:hypothetical protein
MIEVPHFVRVKAHDAIFCSIHANADLAILSDVLDSSEVTIDNLQLPL